MPILGPDLNDTARVEAVLRSLPAWFGIEAALRMYVADTARLPTFASVDGDRMRGFITLQPHFPGAWEIHCLAVDAEWRNTGIGRQLLAHAEDWLRAQGVTLLQVKTVAAASSSAAYAETRAFYARVGFEPLEVFPLLWDAHNPCLQMIKSLRRD